jgi:hypothetical protein
MPSPKADQPGIVEIEACPRFLLVSLPYYLNHSSTYWPNKESVITQSLHSETATAKKLSSVRGVLGGMFLEAHMTAVTCERTGALVLPKKRATCPATPLHPKTSRKRKEIVNICDFTATSDSFVAGLMLAHILPAHDRSTDVHIQGADNSELRDLDAHIHYTQVLGRDAFFFLVTQRNIMPTCKLQVDTCRSHENVDVARFEAA